MVAISYEHFVITLLNESVVVRDNIGFKEYSGNFDPSACSLELLQRFFHGFYSSTYDQQETSLTFYFKVIVDDIVMKEYTLELQCQRVITEPEANTYRIIRAEYKMEKMQKQIDHLKKMVFLYEQHCRIFSEHILWIYHSGDISCKLPFPPNSTTTLVLDYQTFVFKNRHGCIVEGVVDGIFDVRAHLLFSLEHLEFHNWLNVKDFVQLFKNKFYHYNVKTITFKNCHLANFDLCPEGWPSLTTFIFEDCPYLDFSLCEKNMPQNVKEIVFKGIQHPCLIPNVSVRVDDLYLIIA